MVKILIPTDFSENAKNALKYALELFKYERAQFYVVHSYKDEVYAHSEASAPERRDQIANDFHADAEEKLTEILAWIDGVSPNPRHEYFALALNDFLMDAVDSLVDEKNMDIVVMGTHGHTNNPKITFGSHTLQVIKYVQCPVLAIPENYQYKQPKHILFPTNFMIPFRRRELKLLCDLAAPYRAAIDVVYISVSEKLSLRQEDNRLFVEETLCKTDVNYKVIKSKGIVDSIYNYMASHPIDILVMVNTRNSFLENLLFHSPVDEFSLNLDIPFLALQNIRRPLI